MLATLTIDGRNVGLMQANKNGFSMFSTGEGALISAHPVTPIIGPRHRFLREAIENDAVRQLKDAKIVMPSGGAHNWHPMSFNPTTGLVYLGVLNDTAFTGDSTSRSTFMTNHRG